MTVVIKGSPINPIKEVGALGPMLSYSAYVGTCIAKSVVCYPTFKALLKALDKNTISYAVVPLENTTVGGVEGIKPILQRQTSVQIVGEYRLPIKHALVTGKHISNISDIDTVHSHPQALEQCSNITEQYDWNEQRSSSTSAAVLEISHSSNKAAIAPIHTAINGIRILKENIQNLDDNLTRFLLLKKISRHEQFINNWDRAYLFLSVIADSPDSRTALQDAIGMFSRYGVNMRNIASIPNGRKYTSFLEMRYTETYGMFLAALEKRGNLRIHELGRAKLRELKPPSKPKV